MKEDIKIIEDNIDMFMDTVYKNYRYSGVKGFEQAIENLIVRYKELEEKNRVRIIGKYGDVRLDDLLKENYIPKSKIKEKIEELDRRIDYLNKELNVAYIAREKLGTETAIDTNEQYIYNMEREESFRHTQKGVLQELLED